MVTIVVYAFQNISMPISYIIGLQDPFRCDVFQFSLFPVMVIMLTFIMLSVEKFIAVKINMPLGTRPLLCIVEFIE